ncbi:MAG: thioesterase family protein [Prolixibacteraceae bacterium]|jgi:acyl-CoA thioester hydrolase|nr:thioesterase family protein [Prolixibacteraceae bacterium]
MTHFDFETELQVRDYECDIQGIVNNANYLHYLEHCRHQFIQKAGIGFAGLHNEGIDAVVIRAEIDYKSSLRPGEEFVVRLKLKKHGHLRIIFDQQIIRKNDNKLIIDAQITTVLTRKGKPVPSQMLVDVISQAGIDVPEV